MSKVTTKLASLTSEESGSGFHKRFNLLEQLVSEWGNGKCVSRVMVSNISCIFAIIMLIRISRNNWL